MESRFCYTKHTTESWFRYAPIFTPLFSTESQFHCIHIQWNYVSIFWALNITNKSWFLLLYFAASPLTQWYHDSIVDNFFIILELWFYYNKKNYPQQNRDSIGIKKEKKNTFVWSLNVSFYWILQHCIYCPFIGWDCFFSEIYWLNTTFSNTQLLNNNHFSWYAYQPY